MKKAILKSGREKSLLKKHPWVFSGAIQRLEGEPQSGEFVSVFSSDGVFLGQGAHSHDSQIRIRIWSWNQVVIVDSDWIKTVLTKAYEYRKGFLSNRDSNAFRLLHSESDGIPGLIVDVYDDLAVIQILSWGVEVFREEIANIMIEFPEINRVYEKSDSEVRKLEGLEKVEGWLLGGESSELSADKSEDESILIHENGIAYAIHPSGNQKTGFYLDQRENRKLMKEYSKDKEILDCFCFSGGFSLNALVGGAKHVTAVDSSGDALKLLEKNLEINKLDQEKIDLIEADVFKQLRLFRDQAKQFDVIVLDPPKFAPTRAQVNRASRGYKDINLLAFKLLRPGGILFTFSCSGGVDEKLFQQIIMGAALDAEADVQIINKMNQDADHPVSVYFPEGSYLKGIVCRKLK